jgi:U3 small nucleolar RNA-associated protein 22
MVEEAERTASRSKTLLGEVEKSFVVLPAWSSTCHSLALEHPAFRGTTRLAKRWLHAHMFTPYFEEEMVEALVAALFDNPEQYTPPGSAHVGFVRFLRLLAEHDFANEPIVVDMEKALGLGEHTEIAEFFRENRAKLPAVFIATPLDKNKSVWTQKGPSTHMLARMQIFAKNSLKAALDLLQLDTSINTDPDFA